MIMVALALFTAILLGFVDETTLLADVVINSVRGELLGNKSCRCDWIQGCCLIHQLLGATESRTFRIYQSVRGRSDVHEIVALSDELIHYVSPIIIIVITGWSRIISSTIWTRAIRCIWTVIAWTLRLWKTSAIWSIDSRHRLTMVLPIILIVFVMRFILLTTFTPKTN